MNKAFLYLTLLSAGCNLPNDNFLDRENSTAVPAVALKATTGVDGPLQTDSLLLLQKIEAIAKKATAEGYDTHHALLADLGLHSGGKRLFIIDLNTKRVIESGLVTHGSSTAYLPNGKRKYSNADGSLCSSLGMYKIGVSYQGKFGLAYKLYGLNKENSNAYARAVVLHSHSCVPDEESINPICQSWGCPTVSPDFLKTLAQYIKAANKPILLYLFDSSL